MFTLAIPTYNDFNSLSCCLVANLQQPYVSGAVVVDNAPDTAQGKLTASFCQSLNVVYVPLRESVGTAAAKNHAVRHCPEGSWVIGMDSHVVLLAGATAALEYFVTGRGVENDLIHGPLVGDDQTTLMTSFATRWTPERVDAEVARLKGGGHGPERWADLQAGRELWSEGMWGQWDNDPRVRTHPFFPIHSMGMGCFVVNKDTWLGFHDGMRGFGGEEGYIHEKYRKAGRTVWCVSGFRWWHRFAKGEGTPHRVLPHDKYRNYRIGFQELGLDTTDLDRHFESWLPKADWEAIREGRYNPTVIHAPPKTEPGCTACGAPHLDGLPSLADAVSAAASRPSDINEHVGTLCHLARESDGVLDVGSRVESSLALASTPGTYHHLGSLAIRERSLVFNYRKEEVSAPSRDNLPQYDLVFIDVDPHDASHVYGLLSGFSNHARQRVVLHDTVTFGEQGQGGGPGIMAAVRRFVRENPEWTVVRHDRNNHGLLVLSKKDGDKKPLPPLWKQGFNLLKAGLRAKTNVLGEYGPLAGTDAHEKRMELCVVCPSHTNGKCAECGCPVDKKTSWPTEQCPLGSWTTETKELPVVT